LCEASMIYTMAVLFVTVMICVKMGGWIEPVFKQRLPSA